jgi:hypothetical protein
MEESVQAVKSNRRARSPKPWVPASAGKAEGAGPDVCPKSAPAFALALNLCQSQPNRSTFAPMQMTTRQIAAAFFLG